MAACLILTSAAPRARTLPSAAFVWQLAWRPAVSRAVLQNARAFTAWHVLAADYAETGPPALPKPDWPALIAGGHTVIPVVRIEGRVDRPRAASLITHIRALLAGLPAWSGAVEIDHDAATARLQDYAAFLGQLRTALPSGTQVWATALPSWMASPRFHLIADEADRLVLQVHAIDDPRLGLFNATRALAWVGRLADLTRTPFLVALPAYGARVAASLAGVSVSAEAPASDGQPGQEIAADPAEVARAAVELSEAPPDQLVGLAWFRLPVEGDTRAWSAATLRRVAAGGIPDSSLIVVTRRGTIAGVTDILACNAGADDAPPPRDVDLPPGCLVADGLGQYVLQSGRLARRGAGLLGSRACVLAGWMRCSGELHAKR